MTDTARTVAALKALMPNNTDGEITEQTERDFVESIANPVPGGGFDAAARWKQYPADSLYYTVQGLTSPLTFAASTVTPLPLDPTRAASFRQVRDPAGLTFVGPWDYYGLQPAWSVFGLPPGLWFGEAFVTFTNSGNFTNKRYLALTAVEQTWEVGGSPESFFGDPNYFNPVLGAFNSEHLATAVLTQGAQSRVDTSGMVWVPTTGTVAGGRTAFYLWAYQNSGVPLTITDFGATFRRVF